MLRTVLTAAAVLLVTATTTAATGAGDAFAGELDLELATPWIGQHRNADVLAALVAQFNADNRGRYHIEIEAAAEMIG